MSSSDLQPHSAGRQPSVSWLTLFSGLTSIVLSHMLLNMREASFNGGTASCPDTSSSSGVHFSRCIEAFGATFFRQNDDDVNREARARGNDSEFDQDLEVEAARCSHRRVADASQPTAYSHSVSGSVAAGTRPHKAQSAFQYLPVQTRLRFYSPSAAIASANFRLIGKDR
ncbi:uncharacterized protein C8Q71DRAFT_722029 [Rhodofomes roseus]|uniref:Uncharacterized protein n=1 Tax=Rhodofomes roseus TaxID=34475 RepID=A0ABQ8KLI0_9APHY|nr:uncharacterized protein C8Q71DRAFT_722029 [Rhodofomes roseus]KAH9838974.1 hypothetical protein C8Q71DRAFT_722029 [Rhodofomes roseus]